MDSTIEILNNWGHPGLFLFFIQSSHSPERIHQAPQLLWANMTFPFEGYSGVSSASGQDGMQAGEQSINRNKIDLVLFSISSWFSFLLISLVPARLEQSFAWQQTSPCAQTRHFQIWFWWPNLAIIILPTFPYVSPRVVVLLWSFFFCYAREFGIVAVSWRCFRQVKIRRAMLMHYWP